MYILSINNDNEIFKADKFEDVDGAWCAYPNEPLLIGGKGKYEFYFDCCGKHAPAIQAIVKANKKEEAEKYFKEYYSDRFLNKNIIIGQILKVVKNY